MAERIPVKLPHYYYSSLKLLDTGSRTNYSFGIYLSKEYHRSLEDVLSILASPRYEHREPWKKFEITTENRRAEIIYTEDPPEILEIGNDRLILAYKHEVKPAISIPSYKRIVNTLLESFPEISENEITVDTYTEVIFMETNEGILAVIPATSYRTFKNVIIPLLNESRLEISNQISVSNPYDFMVWLYERVYYNAEIGSATGELYISKMAKYTTLKTSSVTHKSKSHGNLDISKNDPIPPISIFKDEIMERLGVILTKKNTNEVYGFDIIMLSANEIGFIIRMSDSSIQERNKYMRRVLFLTELYKRILPTLIKAYESDTDWPNRKEQFKRIIVAEVINRTAPELLRYLCQQTP